MRDILLGLADDLSRGIIIEWLEPADVARLDSAYNNRELSEVFRGLLYAVRRFIFDELRQIEMGDEATVALGFDQVVIYFGRCVYFHCPHVLPGQTQGAGLDCSWYE